MLETISGAGSKSNVIERQHASQKINGSYASSARVRDQVTAALLDFKRGYYSVPIPVREKGPQLQDWKNLRLDDSEIPNCISRDGNRGLLLGAVSGGLVDIDLDAKEAVLLASMFLPETGRRHGRKSKQESHWWYVVTPSTAKSKTFKDIDGDMLVELRGDNVQTLVPPSIHPSGEELISHADGEPAKLPLEQLATAVARLAAAALLARHWPGGSRHYAALALAGTLLRGGVELEAAKGFVKAVCHGARDEEVDSRLRDVETTGDALAAGKETTGQPSLAELLTGDGEKVVKKLAEWLGLKPSGQAWRTSGGESEGGKGPKFDPTAAARDYLACLRQREGLPLDTPVLSYWSGSFYRFSRSWKPVLDEEMAACVGRFLQDRGDKTAVTSAQIKNVVANLKCLTVLDCSDEPAPFYVVEHGPPTKIEKREYVVFENGVVDIDQIVQGAEPQLLPLDRRYFSLVALPFAFDPLAECPRFEAFLQRVLEIEPDTGWSNEPGDRRWEVLQEFFGYCLLPDGRFQKFLLMFGDGANGKSVVQHLLTKLLGEPNVAHVGLDQLSGSFSLQPLLGKMANICGDLNEIDSCEEGILKRLTGQDNLTVNRKGLPHVTMQPNVKFVFACNSLPRFRDRSDGLWRRLIAMPFSVKIPLEEQDPMLATNLEAELPGILNWAIAGLRRLLQNGGFSKCEKCFAEMQKHQVECDPFQQFWDECVVVQQGSKIVKSDVYDRYKAWCIENGRKPVGSSEFAKSVVKKGVTDGRETTGVRERFWSGIRLVGLPGYGYGPYAPLGIADAGRHGPPNYVVPVQLVQGSSKASG